jgi:SAM-dependent methyltransferase
VSRENIGGHQEDDGARLAGRKLVVESRLGKKAVCKVVDGGRSLTQLREHYEIEKALAKALKDSGKERRAVLYATCYDELFNKVPHHPQLARKGDKGERNRHTNLQMKMLRWLLTPDAAFLELGAGDCSLTVEAAKYVGKAYALDISETITSGLEKPDNVEVILTKSADIPLADESIDLAYSNQLMEHLHPEDALDQIREIYRVLVAGGRYFCITPNRLNGPHDISKYFDEVATGLHLKEYTFRELTKLFREAGFSGVCSAFWTRKKLVALPVFPMVWLERALNILPWRARRRIAGWALFKFLLGVKLIAVK